MQCSRATISICRPGVLVNFGGRVQPAQLHPAHALKGLTLRLLNPSGKPGAAVSPVLRPAAEVTAGRGGRPSCRGPPPACPSEGRGSAAPPHSRARASLGGGLGLSSQRPALCQAERSSGPLLPVVPVCPSCSPSLPATPGPAPRGADPPPAPPLPALRAGLHGGGCGSGDCGEAGGRRVGAGGGAAGPGRVSSADPDEPGKARECGGAAGGG